jgi:thiol-disulfide isomerase/thioredoxin
MQDKLRNMKNTLLVLFALVFAAQTAFAQPAGTTFPDFTYDDIEGNTHHLQSYLNQGKTVVIDVFTTWCSVCNGSIPGIEELYSTLGQGGDGSLVLLSFERDASTTNEASWVASNNVEVPVITGAEDLILDIWNVTYQPRYFIICPDGSFEQAPLGGIYSNPQPLIDITEECEMATGLNHDSLKDTFSINSMTADGFLNVNVDLSRLDYQIINLTGSISKTGTLTEGRYQLDLSNLKSGMYFMTVVHQNERLTLRFIKS